MLNGIRVLLVHKNGVVQPPWVEHLHQTGMTVFDTVEQALPESFDNFTAIVIDLSKCRDIMFLLCRRLRKETDTPIILINLDELLERLYGYFQGADICLSSSFSARELELRIRRFRNFSGLDHRLYVSGIILDPVKHTVTVSGSSVDLTKQEFSLLRLFMSNPGRSFNRQEILDSIWTDALDASDRGVDRVVCRLRAKIELEPSKPKLVLTVSSEGYKLALT